MKTTEGWIGLPSGRLTPSGQELRRTRVSGIGRSVVMGVSLR
jgi:hypothetical protein